MAYLPKNLHISNYPYLIVNYAPLFDFNVLIHMHCTCFDSVQFYTGSRCQKDLKVDTDCKPKDADPQ